MTSVPQNRDKGKWVKLEKEPFLTPPRMRRNNCHSCSKIKQLHIVIHFVHWCSATWQLANCDNCDRHGHIVYYMVHIVQLCQVFCSSLLTAPSAPGLRGNSGFWLKPPPQGPGKWKSGSMVSETIFKIFIKLLPQRAE